MNTEPTEAQKEAGNYKKGHVQVGTFDITIEQPEGSIRRGTDADGKKWESKMHNTYGYFRGTEGVDGDHIDVFLSNDIDGWNGRKVFVVDQYNPDGTFDEHKVMLGFNDMDEAKSDYLANYEKGWENGRRIDISSTNIEDFEKWIDSSHRKTKPFSEYSSVNKETVATDKGGEKPEKKQEKQSVFDKAKEIADKEEKKRKAEAEKPKQKPLTEAERKDAEEVAGALGYRVEWVDTMAENGTIDADKKVIRIAKDAENPLVQVLGHEVAHGVKRMDGGKFKALQKAAMEVVGEKEWNERIEKKRKLNAYAEGKLAEEVTCDIVGEALNDKDALKRLAESLRGERGILARLRDAVAKMVEYFKNRGDKEGVRRMKAADKLLAEFESALKEGVAPEQVKPEDVDRSVRENRSEKTELTAEERELRDNLVERMRKGGLDVVTDSEEMQRVIDTENERTRNKRSKKSEAARKRDEALYAVDWSTAFVSGKSREEATEIRRERGRKFKEETKELYGRVLSGNFDDVTLRLIDKFVDKSTPNNPYERPISKRLPARALQKMRGGERTGSIDALFSRISESAVGKDGKALPRAERERAIEEKKKELLKKWAIATGNWHTDIADFTDQREPIGSGTDSDVYLGKDGKSAIKVSKGKPYGKRFRPDVDNVALFNTVFPGSRYTIEGYGEVDGKFVRFLKQPIVDFTSSTPLTEGERVAYMEKLGFKPINKENTAFFNGEIIASDLQKSNIVKDKQGNVRVIDADMKLHTKDVGGTTRTLTWRRTRQAWPNERRLTPVQSVSIVCTTAAERTSMLSTTRTWAREKVRRLT
ncbi:putative polyvalent protein kinase domain-containing protein, partial [Prevotella sp.]|uniref:putative polyvalent protein kinase domain-containing protein n=1 Tax=Prevotella sp. TaxID=59823 RepID=UPI0025F53C6F